MNAALVVVAFFIGAIENAGALEPITLRSRSGQFLVRGLPLGASIVSSPVSNSIVVRLDPAVTAVSCERIKQALIGELHLEDHWRDSITVSLQPVHRHDEAVELFSTRHRDGWQYGLRLPDHVARKRMLKAVLQVLLLEIAQRNVSGPLNELPPWLIEGLAAHLESEALDGLALEPHTSKVAQGRRREPLSITREILKRKGTLNIDQLSWPAAAQISGEDDGQFRACAHLFVRELLRLSEGPACMRDMVSGLAAYKNWQTAFLAGFGRHFRRIGDVEKWWALVTTHVTGIDTLSLWTPEQTLAQLDEALVIELQIRERTNRLPRIDRVTLQHIMTTMKAPAHRPLLEGKVRLLETLRLRAARGLAPLVEAYSAALLDYLNLPRLTFAAPDQPLSARRSPLRDSVQRLNDLDGDREVLRRQLNLAISDVRLDRE